MMQGLLRSVIGTSLLFSCFAAPARADDVPAARAAAMRDMRRRIPAARVSIESDRVARVWGGPLASGDTAQQAADRFVADFAAVFDVPAGELVNRSPRDANVRSQPVMLDRATGDYKFTLFYYTHQRGGLPVFGSEMRVLVANRPDHPVVLASSSLRGLGAFDAAASQRRAAPLLAQTVALADEPGMIFTSAPQTIIWAGTADDAAAPRVAVQFIGDNGLNAGAGYERWLYVADAETGELLHRENQIHHVDVNGNVSGLATQGIGADACGAEVATPMPYALVSIDGGGSAFADVNGNYTVAHGGATPVTVRSEPRGEWFEVIDVSGPLSSLSTNVTPPGPANFTHNAANTDVLVRAQVNAYIQANIVRDFVLASNPVYPVIGTQPDFDIFVNINSSCNAFYDGVSINFFLAGGGCANTAFSSVVHHEYGHHLVQVAGSGQGQYGEGMSDCVALLINDNAILGHGFQGNCSAGIRTADNAVQYPCFGGVHACGTLLSGCVWDLRNELLVTNPGTYRDILTDLTLNSILLHTGWRVTPQIGIDFLVLDDDDADLSNQSPHFAEIFNAFNQHNMIDFVGFAYPLGRPTVVTPSQPGTVRVDVLPQFGLAATNGATLHYRVGNAGPFTPQAMTQIAAGQFEGALPATACPDSIQWYVEADYDAPLAPSGTELDPALAPGRVHQTVAAETAVDLVSYDFEVDPGWTVSGAVTDGAWDAAPGIPINCGRSDPASDYDGSGRCFLTDNSFANNCNSDVDGGSTILTSQVFDLTGLVNPYVEYARYFSNTDGAAPLADTFVVEVSSNGGGSWTTLETVGPTNLSPNPEVWGDEWILRSFRIADFVTVNNQFRIRFTANDTGSGSVIEAGLDAFRIYSHNCPLIPSCGTCAGDASGDNAVDADDIAGFVAALLPPSPGVLVNGCEDMNGDTLLDGTDLAMFISKLLNSADPTACP